MNAHPACDACGYDTSGTDGFCPECGRPAFRFTDRAREVVAGANLEAVARARDARKPSAVRDFLREFFGPLHTSLPACIEPVHFLLALVHGPRGIGYHALLQCGAGVADVRGRLPTPPDAGAHTDQRLPLAPGSVRLIRAAVDEAAQLGNSWVGTEHLLLALCRSDDRPTRRWLRSAGVEYRAVHAYVLANLEALKADPSGEPR